MRKYRVLKQISLALKDGDIVETKLDPKAERVSIERGLIELVEEKKPDGDTNNDGSNKRKSTSKSG